MQKDIDTDKLIKLLGKTTSSNIHESSNAMALLNKYLKENNLVWSDIFRFAQSDNGKNIKDFEIKIQEQEKIMNEYRQEYQILYDKNQELEKERGNIRSQECDYNTPINYPYTYKFQNNTRPKKSIFRSLFHVCNDVPDTESEEYKLSKFRNTDPSSYGNAAIFKRNPETYWIKTRNGYEVYLTVLEIDMLVTFSKHIKEGMRGFFISNIVGFYRYSEEDTFKTIHSLKDKNIFEETASHGGDICVNFTHKGQQICRLIKALMI